MPMFRLCIDFLESPVLMAFTLIRFLLAKMVVKKKWRKNTAVERLSHKTVRSCNLCKAVAFFAEFCILHRKGLISKYALNKMSDLIPSV